MLELLCIDLKLRVDIFVSWFKIDTSTGFDLRDIFLCLMCTAVSIDERGLAKLWEGKYGGSANSKWQKC